MQTHAENYLSERRRLGYGLRTTGYSVLSFARYIDTLNSQEPLTVEIMADWARQDQGNTGNPSTSLTRLDQSSSKRFSWSPMGLAVLVRLSPIAQ